MLHDLQQELNTLLYIYFNVKGLLHIGEDCHELTKELENCINRIRQIIQQIEQEETRKIKVDEEGWKDADAFFEWFSKM